MRGFALTVSLCAAASAAVAAYKYYMTTKEQDDAIEQPETAPSGPGDQQVAHPARPSSALLQLRVSMNSF